MTLIELYNLKLNEYRTTGLKERPWKLLAMLLLAEKDKYEPLKITQGEFYKKYKKQIDKKIIQVEEDFEFTKEELIRIIEETIICDDYEDQKIWFVFDEGFGSLIWGLLYHNEKTGEEIYSKYFNCDDLLKYYNIEQMAIANNITITRLDNLLNKFLENTADFYRKVCEGLTYEERLFILRNLKNKSCSTCFSENCKFETENIEYKSMFEQLKVQGNGCSDWYNAEIIGKSKVLKIDDIRML